MAESTDILASLQKSSKGRLKYDNSSFDFQTLQDIIDDVAVVPAFPLRSPHKTDEHHQKTKIDVKKEETKSPKNAVVPPSDQFSPIRMEIEKKIHDYEASLESKISSPMEERRRLFSEHNAMLTKKAEHQLLSVYMGAERKAEQEIRQAQADELARKEDLKKQQLILKENHLKHAKLLDATLQEANKKQAEDEEKKRIAQLESQERMANLIKIKLEVEQMKVEIEQQILSCGVRDSLSDGVQRSPDLLNQVLGKVEKFLAEAKAAGAADSAKIQEATELRGRASNIKDFVFAQIEVVNKRVKDATEQKQNELKDTKAAADAKQAALASANAAKISAAKSAVSQFADPEGLRYYQKVLEMLQEAAKICEPLTNDPKLKKYKFDLQKSINIPVNAISPNSGSHLKDKLHRVNAILSGQTIESTGRRVTAGDHPAGVTFCKDLFARKIVKQADEQVSSSHDSAFAIAAVTVGVWCEFPDVGHMLMGHFYEKCPYLVPYYMPMKEGQTSEQYYKSLGYVYEDGEMEKQDKFLRRMSGYMRLWASIVVATIPPGPPRAHPQGPEHGWLWLSRALNLDPRPDITATLLYDFLHVTGHLLVKVYSKQFIKVLQFLITDYLPRIRRVTPDGSGGPVARLEVFLERILTTKQIATPQGILTQNFWFT